MGHKSDLSNIDRIYKINKVSVKGVRKWGPTLRDDLYRVLE